ncbi:MAG: cyclase family protein [Synergistaceae bacterium]|jgi:kynurenine formamidase|nr:cyclase family protein [Synergistaceae bacterium]
MDLKKVKYYDLSHTLYHNCPGWPTHAPNIVDVTYHQALHGYNAETLTFNTHTTTHIDAPYHFYTEEPSVDQLSLDHFAGPAVFADLRGKAKLDGPITADMLKPFMSQVEKGDIFLMNTGWCEKRGFTEEYLHQWPYLDGSGAELLIEAGVRAVGSDSLSMGGWGSPEKANPCHLALLKKHIVLIEEMYFPEAVMDGKKRFVTAFPLKIVGASGCPVRVVACEFE